MQLFIDIYCVMSLFVVTAEKWLFSKRRCKKDYIPYANQTFQMDGIEGPYEVTFWELIRRVSSKKAFDTTIRIWLSEYFWGHVLELDFDHNCHNNLIIINEVGSAFNLQPMLLIRDIIWLFG